VSVFSVQEPGAPWSVSRAKPSPGVQVRATLLDAQGSETRRRQDAEPPQCRQS